LTVGVALGATPPEVLEVFRLAADALVKQDAQAFLDRVDPNMPGYEKLRGQIQEMVAAEAVASTIDVITDEGDEHKRELQLDWLLRIGDGEPRRQIVKCTVEKRGKQWKITALEPIEFFKK
jgi:hypothetical protein